MRFKIKVINIYEDFFKKQPTFFASKVSRLFLMSER